MPPVTVTTPAVGDATRRAFALSVKQAIDFLNGQSGQAVSTLSLLNGSFEIGSAANTAPSAWEISIGAGNSSAFETADQAHGKQAFAVTNPGGATGGVILTSLDFIYCGDSGAFVIAWLMKTTVATTTNAVKVRWYDDTETPLSTTTLYSASSGNPTSWTKYQVEVTPPANARLFKVVVEGVNSTTAGTTYWDGFDAFRAAKYKRSVYLTGSGTHTLEKWTTFIRVRGIGGGGGGGGTAGSPGNGGNTTLGSIFTARGGNAGVGSAGVGTPGTGGAAIAAAWASSLLQKGSKAGGDGSDYVDAADKVVGGLGSGAGIGAGGNGAVSTTSLGSGGGGSGGEEAEYAAAAVGGTALAYAVGGGGAAGTNATAGTGGYLEIEEWG